MEGDFSANQMALTAALLSVLPKILPGLIQDGLKKATKALFEEMVGPLKQEIEDLKQQVAVLKDRPVLGHAGLTDELERIDKSLADGQDRNRRDCLHFIGLRKCRKYEVENEVLAFVNEGLGFNLQYDDVSSAHYIGQTSTIIARFRNRKMKEAILFVARKAHRANSCAVTVKESFSVYTRKARGALYPVLEALRHEANSVNKPIPHMTAGNIYYGAATYSWHARRACFEKHVRQGGRVYRMDPPADGGKLCLKDWIEVTARCPAPGPSEAEPGAIGGISLSATVSQMDCISQELPKTPDDSVIDVSQLAGPSQIVPLPPSPLSPPHLQGNSPTDANENGKRGRTSHEKMPPPKKGKEKTRGRSPSRSGTGHSRERSLSNQSIADFFTPASSPANSPITNRFKNDK